MERDACPFVRSKWTDQDTLDIERGKANGILAQPWQTDTCIGDRRPTEDRPGLDQLFDDDATAPDAYRPACFSQGVRQTLNPTLRSLAARL